MRLDVGQIVYIIPEKQTVVYPMRVDEEITKRTLLDHEIVTETDYTLRSGGPNPKHTFFSDMQGEVFESAEHARAAMIERATKSINRHIDLAISKAAEWYGSNPKASADKDQNDFNEIDETAYVDLGNGMKGRVKLNT
jgi:hypothetical protein